MKGLFYLIYCPSSEFERFYVHKVLPNVEESEKLCGTYYPEFAERFTDIKEAENFLKEVKESKYLSKYSWEIVKYEMEMEQVSWASIPPVVEYKNLLK